MKDIRSKFVNDCNFEKENKWVKECPYEIRDGTIRDMVSGIKTAIKEKGWDLKLKFRSKKNDHESIQMRSRDYRKDGKIYPSFIQDCFLPKIAKEILPNELSHDCRLMRTRLGEYYLCLVEDISIRSENQAPKFEKGNEAEGIISLDPGVRTFMTGYSPRGLSVEWGWNDMQRIYRLCYRIDKLQSKYSKMTNKRKRTRLENAAAKMRRKIRNLRDDVHRKLIKYLMETYTVILLPKFDTSKKVKRVNRKINSKCARAMMNWCHYRFRQRLVDKAREYPWVKVIITEEPWTSKTCGYCGFIHHNLGSSKTFNCPSCKQTSDRDIHAARNILLRYLTINEKSTGNGALRLGSPERVQDVFQFEFDSDQEWSDLNKFVNI